jgi:hypothetical protein
MNSQTRITASIAMSEELLSKLDKISEQKQYHNNHGNPSRSKVIVAALDKFLNNGAASSSKQTESIKQSWKEEALSALEEEQSTFDIEEILKEQNDKIERLTRAVKILVEGSMKGD